MRCHDHRACSFGQEFIEMRLRLWEPADEGTGVEGYVQWGELVWFTALGKVD